MEILLVRHGETAGNRGHRHQPNTTPLNATGEAQAAAVAQKIAAWQPTHLVTSTFVRAIETAEVAATALDLIPSTSSNFTELERPASLYGYPHFGLRSIRYMWAWFRARENYCDQARGESYLALIERIGRAKAELEAFPADARVVVFSHSVFISFFVQHVCNQAPLSWWRAGLVFFRIKTLNNSSVTHVRFEPSDRPDTCAWELVSFDDDAHLAT